MTIDFYLKDNKGFTALIGTILMSNIDDCYIKAVDHHSFKESFYRDDEYKLQKAEKKIIQLKSKIKELEKLVDFYKQEIENF